MTHTSIGVGMTMIQYSEAGADFTITGTGWTTTSAVAVPYLTANGIWRLKFNIDGTTATDVIQVLLTFSGIDCPITQSVSASVTNQSVSVETKRSTINMSTIDIEAEVGVSFYSISGDVELSSRPSWAD